MNFSTVHHTDLCQRHTHQCIYPVNSIATPGETISSTGYERRAGGKGANQATAIAKAGGIVELVGGIGEDGGWVLDDLASVGVGINYVSRFKDVSIEFAPVTNRHLHVNNP
jgi:sugar/nucleoside kinase (ribokinase family)